jgi:hypothetical protein
MMSVPVMAPPLTIEYAKLLKQYRHPDAPAVREFLLDHQDDPVFQARARVLNRVYMIDSLAPRLVPAV